MNYKKDKKVSIITTNYVRDRFIFTGSHQHIGFDIGTKNTVVVQRIIGTHNSWKNEDDEDDNTLGSTSLSTSINIIEVEDYYYELLNGRSYLWLISKNSNILYCISTTEPRPKLNIVDVTLGCIHLGSLEHAAIFATAIFR